jgi:hypothetical protein
MVSITSSIRVLAGATGVNVVRARSVNAGSDHLMWAATLSRAAEKDVGGGQDVPPGLGRLGLAAGVLISSGGA